MKKFDCWSCEYRGSVPGSAHICCKHPSVAETMDEPALQLMSIFGSVGRVDPVPPISSEELNIKGDPHGVKNGWFQFPFNFDPVWLENCDGYQEDYHPLRKK